ncbi:lipoate--protein ligase family protein [Yaniella halotolerans]|uniref:lipoate--protein ligase family protein n=1 Tax=Yaniella halotolerans TaxID=225453 RepID=UPI001B7FC580|nr:lipoate--protein ligase family protein [Yaniella halotolerans]
MTGIEECVTTRMLNWVEQDVSLGVAEDLAYSTDLLRAVQHGTITGPIVRTYRPKPTVSFGQQDTRMDGYERARELSEQRGFAPVVRRVGGRAAAYHPGSLIIDRIQPEDDAMFGFRNRFTYFGDLLTATLKQLGANAAVGEIPGEYCAGEYSVHAVLDSGQRIKLAGTAQRVVKGAWLFSTSLVVEDGRSVREVLTDVYDALGLEFDPATAGAVADAVPGLTVEDVTDELLAQYEQRFLQGGIAGQETYELATMEWSELLAKVPPV